MKSQNVSCLYAVLVFSACFIQGFSLPQRRYSADEYGRKFGADPDLDQNFANEVQEANPVAKEEQGLVATIFEIVVKALPAVIDALSGSTGPSQTDRIEGIDLNGEDPFSMRNIAYLGLKLFLAVAGGGANSIDKSDSSPMQGVMEAVISTLTGSNDKDEVAVMAKQAGEVINLIVTLGEALTTSMSQRSFY